MQVDEGETGAAKPTKAQKATKVGPVGFGRLSVNFRWRIRYIFVLYMRHFLLARFALDPTPLSSLIEPKNPLALVFYIVSGRL